MIKAVAGRISRTRTAYTGRHRRARTRLTRIFRAQPSVAPETPTGSGSGPDSDL